MKKKTLFAIVTGVLSCTIATLAKFEIDTLGYWLISLPITATHIRSSGFEKQNFN